MDGQEHAGPVLRAALEYAARGWFVFPAMIDQNGKKKGCVAGGGGNGRRWGCTTDPELIRDYWRRFPDAMVGIECGPDSGLMIVEADTLAAHGKDGIGNLRGLVDAHGGLPDTIEALSPRGSWHLYFRYPAGRRIASKSDQIGPGIDQRGEGGMIVAPPSARADAFDTYRWKNPPPLFDLADCPAWLLALAEDKPKESFRIDTGRSFGNTGRAGAGEVAELLNHIGPDDGGYDGWRDVLMGLHDHFDGGPVGLALATDWSTQGAKFTPGEVEAKWRSFTAGGGIGLGTIADKARQGGADLAEIARRHRRQSYGAIHLSDVHPGEELSDKSVRVATIPSTEAVRESVPQFASPRLIVPQRERSSRFFRLSELEGKPVPDREWLVPELLPMRQVTLLSGDGGTGKSLLTLQLAIAVAMGVPWLGLSVRAGNAIVLSAEDDEDEMHRRSDDILRSANLSYAAAAGVTLRSVAGEDALLAIEQEVRLLQTALFDELEGRAAGEAPTLIVIDTAADTYPSNENDRAKVRQFVGILRGLAIRHACAVVLLGHPSLTGMASGTGTSGSTAWSNSVRSRLYLSRIMHEGYEPDPARRILTVKKANYAAPGFEVPMTWNCGVFTADAVPVGRLDARATGAKAQRVFLALLRRYTEQGRRVNHAGGANYAPKLFADDPGAEGMTKLALRAAMNGLLASGQVIVQTGGPPSRPVSFLAVMP